jgi:hypothetical protein
MLAKMRATLGLPSLVPLSGLFYRVLNMMKFGEHRGGMFVWARGMRDGVEIEVSWHVLAEGDDGPYIPSMAIEAIVRKHLAGITPEAGARPATRALELADYDLLFENRTIYSGFRRDGQSADPLYRQILGTAFDALPAQVKALHDARDARSWTGQAEVRRGDGVMARLVARVIGFPEAAARVPVSVTLSPENAGERWTRNFGGRTFSSLQKRGTKKNDYLLVERFGAIDVSLALVVEKDRLRLIPRRWSLWGIPLPSFLLPAGHATETERNGRFCFDVEIAAPLVGLIVAYKGTLEPGSIM